MTKSLPNRRLRKGATAPYIVEKKIILGRENVTIVRTRDSGRNWSVRFYDPARRAPHMVSLHTKDVDEAVSRGQQYYWSKKTQLERGEPLRAITVQELVERYLKEEELRVVDQGRFRGGIVPDRFKTIRGALKRHFLPFVGKSTPLNKLPSEKFMEYLKFRNAKGAAQSTVKNEVTQIRKMFRFATRYGYVARDYVPEFPKLPSNTQPYAGGTVGRRSEFSLDEWTTLCDYLEDWHKRAHDEDDLYARNLVRLFILIGCFSGLRVSELKLLKWSMIDFPKEDPSKVIIRVPPYGKTGARRVRPFDGTAELLRELKEIGAFSGSGEHLFVDRATRKFLSTRRFYALWRLAITETKLDQTDKDLQYGSLRHTYCTFCLYDNVSPMLVSQNMGTGLVQIQKHYAHISTDMAEKELTKFSKLSRKAKRSPGVKMLSFPSHFTPLSELLNAPLVPDSSFRIQVPEIIDPYSKPIPGRKSR